MLFLTVKSFSFLLNQDIKFVCFLLLMMSDLFFPLCNIAAEGILTPRYTWNNSKVIQMFWNFAQVEGLCHRLRIALSRLFWYFLITLRGWTWSLKWYLSEHSNYSQPYYHVLKLHVISDVYGLVVMRLYFRKSL